jgi:hypothetical protein
MPAAGQAALQFEVTELVDRSCLSKDSAVMSVIQECHEPPR